MEDKRKELQEILAKKYGRINDETITEILFLFGVVLQSEQLTFDCELCEDDGVMITGMDCTCDKAPSKS
tara:strand:- start:249 stop:455 length:207 start_codon:yes stop_codon:yes gene_type:complete